MSLSCLRGTANSSNVTLDIIMSHNKSLGIERADEVCRCHLLKASLQSALERADAVLLHACEACEHADLLRDRRTFTKQHPDISEKHELMYELMNAAVDYDHLFPRFDCRFHCYVRIELYR
jgi:hypothetical protein